MKKYYSQEVENMFNEYLQFLFQANSRMDNCAYSLDTELLLPNTSAVIHQNIAHFWPVEADVIGDLMIQCNMRPKRLALQEDTKIYNNAHEVFVEIASTEDENRDKLIGLIESCDFHPDMKQISIVLEDRLVESMKRLRNYNVWADKVKIYVDNNKQYKIDKDIYNITGLK